MIGGFTVFNIIIRDEKFPMEKLVRIIMTSFECYDQMCQLIAWTPFPNLRS